MKYKSEEERLADLARLLKTDWDDPKAVAGLFLECAPVNQAQGQPDQPENPAAIPAEPPAAVQ